ncbi:hypothetical protein ACLOJK_031816 [Asimina triloba]
MEWRSSPKLQRQASCSCAQVMGISSRWSMRYGRTYMIRSSDDEFDALNLPIAATSNRRSSPSSKTPRWRMLWRMIKRHKRRMFSSMTAHHVPYDPCTYAQNFDHGSAWLEPDNLARSFSARFADPSRIFPRME